MRVLLVARSAGFHLCVSERLLTTQPFAF
jgi:hypothetical protein